MKASLDNVFGIHAEALKLRAKRAELIAANIANADTPGYKARDLDFNAALQNAMGGRPVRLQTSNPMHMTSTAAGGLGEGLMYRVPLHPSVDGNTVDMHIEQSEFARNAVEYQASFNFLDGKIKSIIQAIRGD